MVFLGLATIMLSTVTIAGCKGNRQMWMWWQKQDIVDTVVADDDFNTLITVVQAADLDETLKSEGPFTMFAPTDEAFNKLTPGKLAELLQPENKDWLVDVLKYHVVPGRMMSSQLRQMSQAGAANGQILHLSVSQGQLMVDGATIIKANIKCTNGVIHVIDSVLMP